MTHRIHIAKMRFVSKSILQQVFMTLLIPAWLIAGCEKNSGENNPVAQAGAQSNQQPAPGGLPEATANAGPTAPPPPIAPPMDSGQHPGLGGEMAQHPANQVMQQINQYRQRLEANPKDLEALIALGNANFDIQRFEKAKELYLRALEIDPNNVRVRTDLASAYRNLGDVEKAFEELDRVLSIDPKHETALYNLGVLLLNDRQDVKGAIRSWEKLMATHPHLAYAEDLKKKIEELKKSPSPAKDKP